MKKALICLSILLFCGVQGVYASRVIRLKPAELVKKADVVAIVSVSQVELKAERCHRTTIAQFENPELLKGRMPLKTPLRLIYTIHILVPDCPRVSFSLNPQVQDMKKGQKVIATIQKNKGFKGYKVTSTYSLDELQKIKEMLK